MGCATGVISTGSTPGWVASWS